VSGPVRPRPGHLAEWPVRVVDQDGQPRTLTVAVTDTGQLVLLLPGEVPVVVLPAFSDPEMHEALRVARRVAVRLEARLAVGEAGSGC
jgi:hypothetical protein